MATAQVLKRNGCPLHFWLEGKPEHPLVVFTHGAGADHRMFDTQLATLEGHRILTWDVRGHGQSRPMGVFTLGTVLEDLLAILDSIGAAEATYVGQSMGGNLAQEMARLHPNRVRALALVDCVCNTAALGWLERIVLKITPAMLALYPHQTLIAQSAKASAVRLEVRAYLAEAMQVLNKAELQTVLLQTTQILHHDPQYRIPKPFLLVRGEHDRAGAIAGQAAEWAKREPNCLGYRVIPDAGHCSNQDNPEVFNRVLLEFIQQVTV